MMNKIPDFVIKEVADVLSDQKNNTHATLERLFLYQGAPKRPEGNYSKRTLSIAWLEKINYESPNPFGILAKIIKEYMESPAAEDSFYEGSHFFEMISAKEKITKALAISNLKYTMGGHIINSSISVISDLSVGIPTKLLEQLIKDFNFSAIEEEFYRAIKNLNDNPREALSAASNIIESICKIYIEKEGIEMPKDQNLRSVWDVVRKNLGFDPSKFKEDTELQKIITGLGSIIEGINNIRNRASSAHGAGLKAYEIQPRNARLTVNAAHTITMYIMESWSEKQKNLIRVVEK